MNMGCGQKFTFLASFLGISLAFSALLAGCGGDSESSSGSASTAEEKDIIVDSFQDLLVCSDAREGAIAYVKEQKQEYTCLSGKWVADSEEENESSDSSESSSDDAKSSSSVISSSTAKSSADASSSDSVESSADVSSSDDVVLSSSDVDGVESSSDAGSSSEEAAESSSSEEAVESSSNEEIVESSSSEEVIESSSEEVSSSSEVESSSSLIAWSWDLPKETWENTTAEYDSITDSRDGKVYKIVTIGEQTWMAENLNYADSTSTPILKGHVTCYNNEEKNCEIAGRLYTWVAAIDSIQIYEEHGQKCGFRENCEIAFGSENKIKGICPDGFHLPSWQDWVDLKFFLGLENPGTLLKSINGWGAQRGGLDTYGFNGIPVGYAYMYADKIEFKYAGSEVYYWSATHVDVEDKENTYRDAAVAYDLNSGDNLLYKESSLPSAANYIRCIKD